MKLVWFLSIAWIIPFSILKANNCISLPWIYAALPPVLYLLGYVLLCLIIKYIDDKELYKTKERDCNHQ